jgi:hypothetical protein
MVCELILPDGQITGFLVQPLSQKYFCFRLTQITSHIFAVSSHLRGGSRSSRTRGGMRWTLEVPTTNGAEADGEDVWS